MSAAAAALIEWEGDAFTKMSPYPSGCRRQTKTPAEHESYAGDVAIIGQDRGLLPSSCLLPDQDVGP